MPKYVGTISKGNHFWLENENHVFHRERTSLRSETHQWRCASQSIPKCNARLSTKGRIAEDVEPQIIQRDNIVPHNHPPDLSKILLKEALTEVRKQIRAHPRESVNSIVRTVAKRLPPELLQGPKLDNLKRAGQRARKRILEELTTASNSGSSILTNSFAGSFVKTEVEFTEVFPNKFMVWEDSSQYNNSVDQGTASGITEDFSPSSPFPAAVCSTRYSSPNTDDFRVGDNMSPILGPGQNLGVIGGGTMAKAIIFRLFDLGLLDAAAVTVSGTNLERLQAWAEYGCNITTNNSEVLGSSNVILWAVKPQMFSKVVQAASGELSNNITTQSTLHISVMAGIPLEQFISKLRECTSISRDEIRSVRVMPNIALRVGAGCAVFAMGPNTLASDKELLSKIFSPSGLCAEVQESQINAFCGLFGSGVGFMFPILEAMSDGAVNVGIPREISLRMAAQTMKGAAELLLQEKAHPGVLKDAVCSPGGTTIAGIAELERNGLRNAVISAIAAATKRGEELGRLSSNVK